MRKLRPSAGVIGPAFTAGEWQSLSWGEELSLSASGQGSRCGQSIEKWQGRQKSISIPPEAEEDTLLTRNFKNRIVRSPSYTHAHIFPTL